MDKIYELIKENKLSGLKEAVGKKYVGSQYFTGANDNPINLFNKAIESSSTVSVVGYLYDFIKEMGVDPLTTGIDGKSFVDYIDVKENPDRIVEYIKFLDDKGFFQPESTLGADIRNDNLIHKLAKKSANKKILDTVHEALLSHVKPGKSHDSDKLFFIPDSYGYTPLNRLADSGNIESIQWFVDQFSDRDDFSEKMSMCGGGRNIFTGIAHKKLSAAEKQDMTALLQNLADKKIDFMQKDMNGKDILQIAVESDNPDMIDAVMDASVIKENGITRTKFSDEYLDSLEKLALDKFNLDALLRLKEMRSGTIRSEQSDAIHSSIKQKLQEKSDAQNPGSSKYKTFMQDVIKKLSTKDDSFFESPYAHKILEELFNIKSNKALENILFRNASLSLIEAVLKVSYPQTEVADDNEQKKPEYSVLQDLFGIKWKEDLSGLEDTTLLNANKDLLIRAIKSENVELVRYLSAGLNKEISQMHAEANEIEKNGQDGSKEYARQLRCNADILVKNLYYPLVFNAVSEAVKHGQKGEEIINTLLSDLSGAMQIFEVGEPAHKGFIKKICKSYMDVRAKQYEKFYDTDILAVDEQAKEQTLNSLLINAGRLKNPKSGGANIKFTKSELQKAAVNQGIAKEGEVHVDAHYDRICDSDMNTMLHQAASKGDLEQFKFLIKSGSPEDIYTILGDKICDKKNNQGKTVLEIASESDNPEIVQYILEEHRKINKSTQKELTNLVSTEIPKLEEKLEETKAEKPEDPKKIKEATESIQKKQDRSEVLKKGLLKLSSVKDKLSQLAIDSEAVFNQDVSYGVKAAIVSSTKYKDDQGKSMDLAKQAIEHGDVAFLRALFTQDEKFMVNHHSELTQHARDHEQESALTYLNAANQNSDHGSYSKIFNSIKQDPEKLVDLKKKDSKKNESSKINDPEWKSKDEKNEDLSYGSIKQEEKHSPKIPVEFGIFAEFIKQVRQDNKTGVDDAINKDTISGDLLRSFKCKNPNPGEDDFSLLESMAIFDTNGASLKALIAREQGVSNTVDVSANQFDSEATYRSTGKNGLLVSIAAKYGNIGMVKYLLNQDIVKAAGSKSIEEGGTVASSNNAFHTAAAHGQDSILDYMCVKRKDEVLKGLTALNSEGKNVFDILVENGNTSQALKMLAILEKFDRKLIGKLFFNSASSSSKKQDRKNDGDPHLEMFSNILFGDNQTKGKKSLLKKAFEHGDAGLIDKILSLQDKINEYEGRVTAPNVSNPAAKVQDDNDSQEKEESIKPVVAGHSQETVRPNIVNTAHALHLQKFKHAHKIRGEIKELEVTPIDLLLLNGHFSEFMRIKDKLSLETYSGRDKLLELAISSGKHCPIKLLKYLNTLSDESSIAHNDGLLQQFVSKCSYEEFLDLMVNDQSLSSMPKIKALEFASKSGNSKFIIDMLKRESNDNIEQFQLEEKNVDIFINILQACHKDDCLGELLEADSGMINALKKAKGANNENIIHMLVKSGNIELLEYVLKLDGMNKLLEKDSQGMMPFEHAHSSSMAKKSLFLTQKTLKDNKNMLNASYSVLRNIAKFTDNDVVLDKKRLHKMFFGGDIPQDENTNRERIKSQFLQLHREIANNPAYVRYNKAIDAFLNILTPEEKKELIRNVFSTVIASEPADVIQLLLAHVSHDREFLIEMLNNQNAFKSITKYVSNNKVERLSELFTLFDGNEELLIPLTKQCFMSDVVQNEKRYMKVDDKKGLTDFLYSLMQNGRVHDLACCAKQQAIATFISKMDSRKIIDALSKASESQYLEESEAEVLANVLLNNVESAVNSNDDVALRSLLAKVAGIPNARLQAKCLAIIKSKLVEVSQKEFDAILLELMYTKTVDEEKAEKKKDEQQNDAIESSINLASNLGLCAPISATNVKDSLIGRINNKKKKQLLEGILFGDLKFLDKYGRNIGELLFAKLGKIADQYDIDNNLSVIEFIFNKPERVHDMVALFSALKNNVDWHVATSDGSTLLHKLTEYMVVSGHKDPELMKLYASILADNNLAVIATNADGKTIEDIVSESGNHPALNDTVRDASKKSRKLIDRTRVETDKMLVSFNVEGFIGYVNKSRLIKKDPNLVINMGLFAIVTRFINERETSKRHEDLLLNFLKDVPLSTDQKEHMHTFVDQNGNNLVHHILDHFHNTQNDINSVGSVLDIIFDDRYIKGIPRNAARGEFKTSLLKMLAHENNEGLTPLECIASKQYKYSINPIKKIMGLLDVVENKTGANSSKKSELWNKAIIAAVAAGNDQLAEYMASELKLNLVDVHDYQGRSLLATTLTGKSTQKAPIILSLLNNKGMKINAIDVAGNTAMHDVFNALYNNDVELTEDLAETMKLMIAKGADLSVVNKDGVSAIELLNKLDKKFNGAESLNDADLKIWHNFKNSIPGLIKGSCATRSENIKLSINAILESRPKGNFIQEIIRFIASKFNHSTEPKTFNGEFSISGNKLICDATGKNDNPGVINGVNKLLDSPFLKGKGVNVVEVKSDTGTVQVTQDSKGHRSYEVTEGRVVLHLSTPTKQKSFLGEQKEVGFDLEINKAGDVQLLNSSQEDLENNRDKIEGISILFNQRNDSLKDILNGIFSTKIHYDNEKRVDYSIPEIRQERDKMTGNKYFNAPKDKVSLVQELQKVKKTVQKESTVSPNRERIDGLYKMCDQDAKLLILNEVFRSQLVEHIDKDLVERFIKSIVTSEERDKFTDQEISDLNQALEKVDLYGLNTKFTECTEQARQEFNAASHGMANQAPGIEVM